MSASDDKRDYLTMDVLMDPLESVLLEQLDTDDAYALGSASLSLYPSARRRISRAEDKALAAVDEWKRDLWESRGDRQRSLRAWRRSRTGILWWET